MGFGVGFFVVWGLCVCGFVVWFLLFWLGISVWDFLLLVGWLVSLGWFFFFPVVLGFFSGCFVGFFLFYFVWDFFWGVCVFLTTS